MTYATPPTAIREALTVARSSGIVDANTAADAFGQVVSAAAQVVAQDVVSMTAAALSAIEQHDPSCLSLYGVEGDDPACDCSWAQVAEVVAQLKAKVGIVT